MTDDMFEIDEAADDEAVDYIMSKVATTERVAAIALVRLMQFVPPTDFDDEDTADKFQERASTDMRNEMYLVNTYIAAAVEQAIKVGGTTEDTRNAIADATNTLHRNFNG